LRAPGHPVRDRGHRAAAAGGARAGRAPRRVRAREHRRVAGRGPRGGIRSGARFGSGLVTADWDGEEIVERVDPETGTRIVIALHSSRLGPPTGGTRMMSYADAASARRDAMRLAEAMTYKWAAAAFPRGGGKAVLAVPPDLPPGARPGLLRRYGALLHELGGRFWTGGDVGASSRDMDVLAPTGAPYR